MTEETTQQFKEKLDEIRKKLVVLGSKESNFMGVEMLFYDAITIARTYGNDSEDNKLLFALKELEAGAYSNTKSFFKKSHQREHVIRRFIVQFKNILASAIRDNASRNTLSA
jgi:hypothetical protein